MVYSAQPTLSFRDFEIYPLLAPISCKNQDADLYAPHAKVTVWKHYS